MSDTCRLFPPFGDPWPSCLLPSQYQDFLFMYHFSNQTFHQFLLLQSFQLISDPILSDNLTRKFHKKDRGHHFSHDFARLPSVLLIFLLCILPCLFEEDVLCLLFLGLVTMHLLRRDPAHLWSRAAVPNLFDTQDQLCRRQCFHGPGAGGMV